MKCFLRIISFVSSLLLLFSLALTAVSAATEEKIELTATTADEWTAIFDRKNIEKSWLGGDGIYAVSLDGNDAFGSATKDSTTFFIFSDSLMGTSDAEGNVTWAPGQPSQTSAVLKGNTPDPENIEFVWGTGGSREFGWEQHLFGEHKWMLDCFVVKDSVYIFGFPEQEWKPKQIDMIKIPIEDNEPKYYKYSETESISELWYKEGDKYLYAYGIGVMSNTESAGAPDPDGYIYIYGYCDNLYQMSRKDMIAARVKESDFPDFSKTEYWNGKEWCDDITESKALIKNVSCEMSVSPITVGPYKGKYIAVYTEGTESSAMKYAIGETPVGPFDKSVTFYAAPEHGQDNGGMYTYNAKAYPHLSSGDKLLVSYNCNNRNTFGQQKTYEYHPRFLWLDLDPLDQDKSLANMIKNPIFLIIAAAAVVAIVVTVTVIVTVNKKKKTVKAE